MRLPIRARLVLGLVAIILLIAGGAVYLLLAVRTINRAVDEVRRRSDAVRYSLTLASSIRAQYAHEAHVLLLPDAEDHVHHFDDAVKNTQNCLAHLREGAGSAEEVALVSTIAADVDRFGRLFYDGLLPAFRSGDREAALRIHHESEELAERVVRLNDDLSGRLLARIDETQHGAERLTGRAIEVGAAVLLAVTGLAAGIAWYLVRSIHRPIDALVRGTRAVARGDLDAKITFDTPDEFGALAESFNEMTSRLRANQEELLRAEKFASLGSLAAGVAHQINNPLGVIVGYAGVLGDSRYDAAAKEKALAAIRREAEECRTIVRNLMALARPGSLERERVAARDLVSDVLAKAGRYTKLEGIRIVQRGLDGTEIETDRRKLEQALLNLVVNAVEAMEGAGKLEIEIESDADGVSISVADSGPGIPAEVQTRLFDPYYTTKPDGTGLGLALAYGLVRALGGRIDVKSEPGQGARFTIRLQERRS